jgi:hypothetical protein
VEPLTIIDDPADWKAKVREGKRSVTRNHMGQYNGCKPARFVHIDTPATKQQPTPMRRFWWPGKHTLLHQHDGNATSFTLQDLRPEDYTYPLSPSEVAEIISGTDQILAKGVKDEEDIKKVLRVE